MKTVLFDFDYTLVNSSGAIVRCFQEAAVAAGHEAPSGERILAAMGQMIDEIYLNVMGTMKGWPVFWKTYIGLADQVMSRETIAFEDTIPTLQALKQRGYRLGIISPKFRYRITEWLDENHLRCYFDLVIGGDDVTENMPSPEGIIKAIVVMNSPKNETCFVGDNVHNMRAADSAKVKFIPVLTGSQSLEVFQAAGFKGTDVADSLSDILRFLP